MTGAPPMTPDCKLDVTGAPVIRSSALFGGADRGGSHPGTPRGVTGALCACDCGRPVTGSDWSAHVGSRGREQPIHQADLAGRG